MSKPEPLSSNPNAEKPAIQRSRTGPWFQFRYPDGFEWNRVRLPVPGLPNPLSGMRIVHLSDLHLGRGWGRSYDELIERVNGAAADLVLITGDIVEDKFDHRSALPTAGRLLSALKARHGLFTVLGNHDTDLLLPRIRDWGVIPLHDCVADLQIRQSHVSLIGLPGVSARDYRGESRVEPGRVTGAQPGNASRTAKSSPATSSDVRIVLSHYPVHVRNVGHLAPHLFLSGHTHGGQVCLPGGVAIITHSRLGRPYHRGIHRIEDTWLVVNRGFGFATVPIRLFCPAEVLELELVAG